MSTLRHRRDRILAFLRLLTRRFLADRCLESAGSLAYTTLFALVPLTAAVLGILSAFPVFQQWRSRVTDFVFENFVPATGKVVQTYLTEFADKASQATAVGILVLVFSAVMLMISIEDAFNRIWRVRTGRRAVARFLVYWTALSFGPLLLVTALGLSSYLFALPLLDEAESGMGLKTRLLGLAPFAIVWVGLVASYLLVPNRSVRFAHAAWGALLAALLFEAAKRAFGFYVANVPSYEQVYGTLAVVPIFLLWIYLSWIVILLGASFAATLGAFSQRRAARELAPGHEFLGLLTVLGEFVEAQREGRGLHSRELCRHGPVLDDDLIQRYLGDLNAAGLVQRAESGEW